jgi:hypothetical protein
VDILKKINLIVVLVLVVVSCKKEVKIDFTEAQIETLENAEISINFPKAEGSKDVANRINTTLQNYIVNQTNLSEDSLTTASIEDAVRQFDTEYIRFKTDFPESSQKWEAFIDGEVTYRSPEVICIAINSYLDTGGAHGNTNVRFFNFNPQTGSLLKTNDLIADVKGLSEIVKQKLKEEIKDYNSEDSFFGEKFQLPETLGFSDEGIIILYNPYEIASYAQGIIEFTIPYEDVNSFLNIN